MKNFGRALRLAANYPWNVAGCFLSALLVAGLWAGSLSSVFPVVDVIMTDRSLPEWIDDELSEHQSEVSLLKQRLTDLEGERALANPAEVTLVEAEILDVQRQLTVHDTLIGKYAWLGPHTHKYLPTSPFNTLLLVLAFLLTATLLKSVFRIMNSLLVARLGCKITFDLRNKFYQQVLDLDVRSLNARGGGDLMNRCTTDLNWIYTGVRTLFGESLLEPLKIAACLSIAAWVSWRLLLITLIVAPVAGLLIHVLAKGLKRAHRRTMQELSSVFESMTETLGAIKLIQAYNMEAAEKSRFLKTAKHFHDRQLKTVRYSCMVSPLTELLGMVMVGMAAVMGGYLVLNHQTHLLGIKISNVPLTHGAMSVFFAMLAGMADPSRRLSSILNRIQQAVAASDRVYEVLDRQSEICAPHTPKPVPRLTESLDLHNVCFHYDAEQPVLRGISLSVRAGETIAIVGTNGCGKSTLLNLVPRFYDPTHGALTIDGVDLREVCPRELRSRIGLVSQETLLLNETVAFNIAYGSEDASAHDIETAAQKAHAHDFITQKLSDGYQTVIGPRGGRLSGGQRQRIALARAILRDPELLILDEATSQVDLESEQTIHSVLSEFMRGRTSLVVTHRMSTVTLADRVVVMNKGKIVDVGTHDELIARCVPYQRLANIGGGRNAA